MNVRKLCAPSIVDLPLIPGHDVARPGTYILVEQPGIETMSASDQDGRHLYSNPPGWTLSYLEEWKHYN